MRRNDSSYKETLKLIRQADRNASTSLDLNSLELESLPPEILKLTSLTTLNLDYNGLTSLPPEIGKLTNLTELHLADNQLTSLPPVILKLTNLTTLNLDYNGLTSLPPEIGKLTNLTKLHLYDNQLTVLPSEIGKLTNLTTLVLYSNQLTSLPPEIGKLTKLETLLLTNNQLTFLPPEIGKLTNLMNLDLRKHRLTSLPPEIGELTSLTTLNLDYNGLTSLPPEIGKLTNLTELHLADIQLTSLPPEIGKLTNLTELHLADNQLTSLPPEIGELTNLTELHLADNQLTSLPPEIGELTKLETLLLTNNQLTFLPPEIGKLTCLTNLDLRKNRLTVLPSEIGKLTNLTTLVLYSNQLTSLPPEIGELTKLETLLLTNNQLTFLPPEIGKLTCLTNLDLRKNRLTVLPSEIGKLTNLTTLVLGGNKLTKLPPVILKLTNLTTLNLDYNGLTSLPPEIGKLTNLTELHLAGNQLTSLPPEIGKLTNLVTLHLKGNPLETPPIEIVNQGIDAVRTYFKEIEEQVTSKLFEAKLLIVGQGGVGKTYLLNRLIRDEVDPSIMSTEGIDINRWSIPTKQTDDFTVNCWDFGGQEIYHATHQFFLTKRSLYLFVWEARTDADLLSFDYWLNTIKVLSDNSPVLVIQNKIDERKKSINQEGWKNKFHNIVEYHDVSAQEATGIDSLKDVIVREIQKLPHIGDVLPKRWMDIRQRLEGLNENFIPYSYYQEICSEFGMNDEQTELLSGYYHDLGVFLYFHDNPILRNTIFLKPEWATNAVYKVTDDKQIKNNFGKFSFNELRYIWSDKNEFPPAKHVDLVELMKSFELCFELPMGQEYIIPELLRANQPEVDWDYAENLRFKYEYDFMPAGVMTRFIVITHDLIKSDLYWKDGLVLEWENTDALIIKTDSRVIQIWISGDDKTTFLGMIRRHMDYIHSPFHNLEVNEMIPCICDECQKAPDPYFYPYHNLRKAREKRIATIQCQNSFDAVSIKVLLGGIETKTPEKRATRRQHIKIFLASSSELREERTAIELFIGKENRKSRYKNIFLDLVIWEDLKQSFHGERIQDYFNEQLLECDVVLCMFFKKVGVFTKEEFDVAYQHFKEDGKPRYLYVFFKSGKVDIDEIDEEILKIGKLKNEIEEAEQIYKRFDSDDNLILQLRDQLDLIVSEIVYL